MPATRKLPPVEKVQELVARGMTHAEIGKLYGVTRQAVGTCLANAGVPTSQRPHISYADHIPWQVKAEHNDHKLVRRLRMYARVERGGTLRPDQLALLDRWVAYMRKEDAVVCYDRDYEDGFYLSRRRPGDLFLIRPPAPENAR